MYKIKNVSLKYDLWYETRFITILEVGETYTGIYIVSIELNSDSNPTYFVVNFKDNTQIIIPYHNVAGYEVGE